MLFAKKIKQILLLVFLVSVLASCDKVCYEADQFYAKVHTIYANGKINKNDGDVGINRTTAGAYNDENGGEIIEWQNTGLNANGDDFLIAISGGWNEVGGDDIQEKEISKMPSCRLCFKLKDSASGTDNCICGPTSDDAEIHSSGRELVWESPQKEEAAVNGGSTNPESTIDCKLSENYNKTDLCTCQPLASGISKSELYNNNYFSFSRNAYLKTSSQTELVPLIHYDRKLCAYKMGVGLYVGLVPPDHSVPPVAYHLASSEIVCPPGTKTFKQEGGTVKKRCVDDNGVDKTKVIYRSPGRKIFKKVPPGTPDSSSPGADYHQSGDEVRLNIFDQYLSDNGGKYRVEFIRGVISTQGNGLIAEIVTQFDRYLFGANYYDHNIKMKVVERGVVEYMYQAVLNDKIVRNIISISLVMYISFFGLAFFMGMTDFGKKEIMMRLLKIGLVILFTNVNAWQMYNSLVITFFKNGMDKLVAVISGIFESNMDRTLTSIAVEGVGSENFVEVDAGKKFMFSDRLIMDLISKPNMSRIFGLLWIPGKGFFALLYIPIILFLILYFIYMVLDVALKYLINLLKICIGLALGPVFILFSLFEKTKDMFNNWLAFVASRTLEIVILFTMLHPFLVILDGSFKDMLAFKVCSDDISVDGFWNYSIYKASDTGRSIFDWAQYFLKIAALIFITKSVCDKAGFISGQLISIGGVANADPVSDAGRGESGFNMASSIVKGAVGLAKTVITNSKISQAGKFAGRAMIRGLTSIGRAKIGESGSINDMVNNAFKAVGIRNRGLRSYMRDREIDKAIGLAEGDANQRGLEGREKHEYIMQNAQNRINIFQNENKNKAVLLGIDNKNIEKRLDKKLLEAPIKEHIKKQAKELKLKGIHGKDARDIIEKGVGDWANKNLNFSEGLAKRKISKFFKKTSVKGSLESSTAMSASEGLAHFQKLLASGDNDAAKTFGDKYKKDNAESYNEKLQQREENKREGGVFVKGFAGGVNILGKVFQPVMLIGKYGAKAINWTSNKLAGRDIIKTNFYKDYKLASSKVYASTKVDYLAAPINAFIWGATNAVNIRQGKEKREKSYQRFKINSERFRRFFGKVDNLVVDVKDSVFGGPAKNQKREARKFHRGLARAMLKPENLEKMGDTFDKELSRIVDKKGRSAYDEKKDGKLDGEKFKPIIANSFGSLYKKDDSILKKGLKVTGKVLFFPIYVPGKLISNSIKKDDYPIIKGLKVTGKALFFPIYIPYKLVAQKIKRDNEFKKLHREDKLSNLRELAKDKNQKIKETHNENISKNLGKQVHEKTKALDRLEKSSQNRDSMEKLALMMKKMEKTAKKQETELRNEEIKKKYGRLKRVLIYTGFSKEKGNIEEVQIKRLTNLNDEGESVLKGEDTVFERLSKIEGVKKVDNLKSEYMKEVNKEIDKIKEENISDSQKLEKLEALKGALFISIDELQVNTELKSIFEKVTKKFTEENKHSDVAGGSIDGASNDSGRMSFDNAQDSSVRSIDSAPGDINQSVNESINKDSADLDSIKTGSNLAKQQELLKNVYEAERKITEKEEEVRYGSLPVQGDATNNVPVAPPQDPSAPDKAQGAPAPAPALGAQVGAKEAQAPDKAQGAPAPAPALGAQVGAKEAQAPAPAPGAQVGAQTQGARDQDDLAAGIENLKKENEKNMQSRVEMAIGGLVLQGVRDTDCRNIVYKIVASNPSITDQELIKKVLLILGTKK